MFAVLKLQRTFELLTVMRETSTDKTARAILHTVFDEMRKVSSEETQRLQVCRNSAVKLTPNTSLKAILFCLVLNYQKNTFRGNCKTSNKPTNQLQCPINRPDSC